MYVCILDNSRFHTTRGYYVDDRLNCKLSKYVLEYYYVNNNDNNTIRRGNRLMVKLGFNFRVRSMPINN